LVNAFCCFSSLLSFWLPWIYSPFPLFMEFRNGVLLQLIECIESTQNEVKRKMIETRASTDAPKSHARLAREEKVRVTSQLTLPWSPIPLGPPRERVRKERSLRCAARTLAKLSAIYNERRFQRRSLEGARLKSALKESGERNHGRFE
jgi:hypothetical protein